MKKQLLTPKNAIFIDFGTYPVISVLFKIENIVFISQNGLKTTETMKNIFENLFKIVNKWNLTEMLAFLLCNFTN